MTEAVVERRLADLEAEVQTLRGELQEAVRLSREMGDLVGRLLAEAPGEGQVEALEAAHEDFVHRIRGRQKGSGHGG